MNENTNSNLEFKSVKNGPFYIGDSIGNLDRKNSADFGNELGNSVRNFDLATQMAKNSLLSFKFPNSKN